MVFEIIDEADQVGFETKPKRIVTKKVEQRRRKTKAQLTALNAYFNLFSTWEKSNIAEAAKLSGLSNSQVYKWYWEQKRQN